MSKERSFDGKKLNLLKTFEEFAVLVAVMFVLFNFVIGVSWVDGTSMTETLKDRDTVVYLRLVKEYKKGDIVSIRMPSGQYYIKRVVGTEGDTIDIHDGKLYVNGEEETADYVYGRTEIQSEDIHYPIILTEGQIFALGDNREGSVDSRTFGPMAVSQIRGKIFLHF